MTDRIWQRHKSGMTWLRDKHSAERQTEREAQGMSRKAVSSEMAKAALVAERGSAPRPFNRPPDPLPEWKSLPPPERFREGAADRLPAG